jgi:AmmeMemoRadiSam system protein A
MMPESPIVADALTEEEKQILLRLAREALVLGVNGRQIPPLDLTGLPPRLQQTGASFVTLTERGELRGCIGTLDPYQPLAEDVREHAVAAALHDYRFPPVRHHEVVNIQIEISRLTLPQPLEYKDPDELVKRLRPNIDGVVLRDGMRRATFLPQVWEKLPDPASFLTYLCEKMGAPGHLWRRRPLQVFTYQVEEFRE